MITLRPAAPSDLALLRHWDEQPHVVASDPNDDWQWEQELARTPAWREQLIAELDGRPIGFVQIIDPAREESRYWGDDVAPDLRALDIWIGEAADLGRGYGTRIMELALARCFREASVEAVLIDPLASNTRAHRFYERLGFEYVERRRFGGDDCMVYRLPRERWVARHGGDAQAAVHRSAHDVVALYERTAAAYDSARGRSLQERAWLERFLAYVPRGGAVLDLGCGMGEPIARYLLEQGRRVVGVDAAPSLIALCRERFAQYGAAAEWQVADMRTLECGRRFEGIVAWDSFFHLSVPDQRAMFARFEAHAAPGGALLFTSGGAAGEAIGEWGGAPLHHASLAPAEYERLLAAHGFRVRAHVAGDAECGGHTVWLATRAGQDVA